MEGAGQAGGWIGRGPQPRLGGAVLHDIDAEFLPGAFGQVVEEKLIHVGTTELGVAAGGFDLKYSFAELHDSHIQGAAAEVDDGNAQFFTLGTTIPAGAVMDLASAREIRLMPIPDDGLKNMQQFNPGYMRGIIPKRTYPRQTEDVPTVEYATHFIARCELDDQFVYDVLDSIYGGIGDLASIAKAIKGITPEKMGKDIGVPLHPGAARWYRENAAG